MPSRETTTAFLIVLTTAASGHAQGLARVSADPIVAVDYFAGNGGVTGAGVVFAGLASVRLDVSGEWIRDSFERLTLRAGYFGRKPFAGPDFAHQIGASLVWARRWW